MRVTIDRFEEDRAVVELDGEMLSVPRILFEGAREGDAAEITILPKEQLAADSPDDNPRAMFVRLRRKKRRRR